MKDFLQHGKSTIGGAEATMLDLAKGRLILVAAVLMLGYLAVSLRLADLTLLRPKHVETVLSTDPDRKPLAHPLRGEITDRNGIVLATSLPMASVSADTTIVEDPHKTAHALAGILSDQTEDELYKKLSSGKKFIWIARNVPPKQEYAINALGQPALVFQEEERRIYPGENETSHLVGYTDVDGNGISGIENAYNKRLAEGDRPVKLTVDIRIQHILHRELAATVEKFHAKAGIGMVMDVNTGEIIAMVSLPDFNPYHPGDATDQQRFNRATLGVFEMGSTFKLFSIAAALDSGKVSFASEFDASQPIKYGRFTISDYHAKKRKLTVPEIFIYSSNIGTAKMAESLGPNAIKDFYDKVGFLDEVPLKFPERGAPLYPKPWRDISTLTTAFGHGIAVSPLHVIRAGSSVVNGGTLIKPVLVLDDDKPLSETPEGPEIVKSSTSAKLRQLLELVVANGTGGKAYVEGYNVGGKTGTAEKNLNGVYIHDSLLSSFLGFYPIEKPRYAVLAILDEPHGNKESYGFATAGWTAAPVVSKVISQMGPLYNIPPSKEKTNITDDMSAYLKEIKKGTSLASPGDDR